MLKLVVQSLLQSSVTSASHRKAEGTGMITAGVSYTLWRQEVC